MKSHLEEKPIPPKQYNRNIPKWLNKLILKCISKDKDSRYISADELLKALKTSTYGNRISLNFQSLLNSILIYLGVYRKKIHLKTAVFFIFIIALAAFAMARLIPEDDEKNIVNNIEVQSSDIILKSDLNKLPLKDSMELINNSSDTVANSGFVVFEPGDDSRFVVEDENTDYPSNTGNVSLFENSASAVDNNNYVQPVNKAKKLKKKKYINTTPHGEVNKPKSKWKIRK